MNDPIKVILKYKNDNKRTQYNIYLFIGDIPKKVNKVLMDIQELNLYDTFMKLSKDDLIILDEFYGELWYKKIFNTYHINYIIEQILKNKTQQTDLIKKRGEKWYDQHIKKYKLVDRNIIYNYGENVRDELLLKEHKKRRLELMKDVTTDDYTGKKQNNELIENMPQQTPNSDDIDLTLSDSIVDSSLSLSSNEVFDVIKNFSQKGGHYDELDDDDRVITKIVKKMNKYDDYIKTNLFNMADGDMGDEIYDEDDNSIDLKINNMGEEMVNVKADETVEDAESFEFDELSESIDIEELEKLYQDTDVVEDINVTKTSNLIKEALDDNNIYKKVDKSMIEFDESKNNLGFDDNLRNVFYKNYVTTQYIFKDDTIKNVKNKICVSIKNSKKYGDNSYIMPSRQYLWSEYIFDNKVEKVMIGQKWIRRTELLPIDIEINNNIRYYEELRENLKSLKDNLKRYGSKIKREDDDHNILYDYNLYFTNNEIFMVDIYNDLGKGYNPDTNTMKNLISVYKLLYFPRIKNDDMKHIVDYLNGDDKYEKIKMQNAYDIIVNDLLVENEIIKIVEGARKPASKSKIFKDLFITHSVIHINLKTEENKQSNLDLYRIFSKFEISQKYPFIQYQTLSGQLIFKYSEKYMGELSEDKQNLYVMGKWFENAPYGISFKMRVDDESFTNKYMAINLNDMGRMEYKIQWKEDDKAVISNIYTTYAFVRGLIKKINSENNKVTFVVPRDEEFKYAFLNSIQQFEFPEKYAIRHNDLSDFSRFFFPYVATVVEPRKRLSKVSETDIGKFGTYLRYKRVSKYENQQKIEQKILYFLKNYEYTEQLLIDEIVKQFNISQERAMEELQSVKLKYPNIKKSRNQLKKIDIYAKHKPPGISVDIQGKQRDRYKVRASGIRDVEQLSRIESFYRIFLYLYFETYLVKNPEYQVLKEKLEKLTNIAKRRKKVSEIVDFEKDEKIIKGMQVVDKSRLGFTPEKGQNQWSRSCQNNGTLIRQPSQFTKLDELLNLKFKFDEKTNTYTKKAFVKTGDGKKEITIRAIALDTRDDDGNKSGSIYYTCNPDTNGENVHVGFLSKSNNPTGQCMPCCFKKDPLYSVNVEKVDHFKKCALSQENKQDKTTKIVGDRLYILQDSNKIPEGRLGFLPTYLNFYLNKLLGKTKAMRQNSLAMAKNGYYFKMGVNQENQKFLGAISAVLDIPNSEIIKNLVDKLENDKCDTLFTALNNGDIRTSFVTREKYIDFLTTSKEINYEMLNHILGLHFNVNILIFKKEEIVLKVAFEKEVKKDDYFIMCQNYEEVDNVLNPKKNTILLLKENSIYYPIVYVTKINENVKDITITKKYKYGDEKDNIIEHIYDFYKRNCVTHDIEKNSNLLSGKELYKILADLNIKEYLPQYQFVDVRNKCKYLITNNGIIIGTKISGSVYNLRITKTVDDKLMTFDETINKLNKFNTALNGKLKLKPVGVYFNFKNKGDVTCVGIMTEDEIFIPIKQIILTKEQVKKLGFKTEYKQLYEHIDNELAKGNKNVVLDDRISNVKKNSYEKESYELFRLQLSEYLSLPDQDHFKRKIIKILGDKSIDKKARRSKIKGLLFKRIDKYLYQLYEKYGATTQDGGSLKKIVLPINKLPDLNNYIVKNDRTLCNIHKNKNECEENKHCHWFYEECNFSLMRETIIIFVNKVSDEFVNGGHKLKELLQIDNYFVTDIVDYTVFEEIPGQKIVNSSNKNINKILEELFEKDNIPKIGKKRLRSVNNVNIQELNETHAIYDMGNYYSQEIINNNMTLMRAFANGYIWLKHLYYDLDSRNIGYYNNSQTDLANYFMSNILDWLIDYENQNALKADIIGHVEILGNNFVKDYVNKISRSAETLSNGIIEYYILNKIHKIPIIVYDNYDNIQMIIDDGIVYDINTNKESELKNEKYDKYTKITSLKNYINIKYVKVSPIKLPLVVQAIYYK